MICSVCGFLWNRETRYAYKKGFLLSLAEMDECKRLPRGFDSSTLWYVSIIRSSCLSLVLLLLINLI
jgi:hypothetical protein